MNKIDEWTTREFKFCRNYALFAQMYPELDWKRISQNLLLQKLEALKDLFVVRTMYLEDYRIWRGLSQAKVKPSGYPRDYRRFQGKLHNPDSILNLMVYNLVKYLADGLNIKVDVGKPLELTSDTIEKKVPQHGIDFYMDIILYRPNNGVFLMKCFPYKNISTSEMRFAMAVPAVFEQYFKQKGFKSKTMYYPLWTGRIYQKDHFKKAINTTLSDTIDETLDQLSDYQIQPLRIEPRCKWCPYKNLCKPLTPEEYKKRNS
jgi:hypothetical protein